MQCRTCLETDPEKFSFKNKKTGQRNGQCKVCFNAWRRQYYKLHKDYYLQNSTTNKIKQRSRNREKVRALLVDSGCTRCPERDVRCLDFHHLHSKDHSISELVQGGRSWSRIAKEIEKCIILCANCHRKEHGDLV